MDKFLDSTKKYFSDWGTALSINDLMLNIRKNLSENGFQKGNSRLVFSVCPDDINRLEEIDTVEVALTKNYNGEFHLGGLGAYPMGGVSGIIAASHHPPENTMGEERKHGNLIFFVSPHFGIAINDAGNELYGKILRPGQSDLTNSCGAMMGFLAALKECGSPEAFIIAADTTNTDPSRIALHNDLINSYSDRLKAILSVENSNQQVVDLFKLNYDVVMNKIDQMINIFLEKEKEHFKAKIALIAGITINVPGGDRFVLKEISYPNK